MPNKVATTTTPTCYIEKSISERKKYAGSLFHI